MHLKTHAITGFSVDYSDLEDLVKHIRPDAEYSFVANQEMSNDSTFEASGISAEIDPDPDNTKEFEAFLDGDQDHEPMFATKSLLHILVKRGLAPAGNYYIEVCS